MTGLSKLLKAIRSGRSPEMTEGAQRLRAGEDVDYQTLVDRFKPVRPYEDLPPMATMGDLDRALHENKRPKIGKLQDYPEGYPVSLRLDIPAYTDHDVWAPTIHDGKTGKTIAHEPAARVMGPRFTVPESKALNVAAGGAKSPFATIDGELAHMPPEEIEAAMREAMKSGDWRQVGMDPERHSFFYDRATQEPIIGGREAMQLGPLVLVRDAVKGKKGDFRYEQGGPVEMGGDGTHNYVTFGDDIVDIRRKYDKGGIVEGGIKALANAVRGKKPKPEFGVKPTDLKRIDRDPFMTMNDPPKSELWDFSRLDEPPRVPQFDLERYDPPRGVSQRVQDLVADKDVRDLVMDKMAMGVQRGGPRWYNNDPLLDDYTRVLGPEKGPAAFNRYMQYVSAASPRSDVGANARNASYYYGRDMRGEGMPEVGSRNPQPYGHMAQRLHQMNAKQVFDTDGNWDVLKNPKPPSFGGNLAGNWDPVAVDAHATRLPAMLRGALRGDTRFLVNSYKAGKDVPTRNIRQEVESGAMSFEDALKEPTYWMDIPNKNEYAELERYWKGMSRDMGLRPAQGQASGWVGGGNITGLASDADLPFLGFLEQRVMLTAKKLGMEPRDVLDKHIRGEISLYAKGGPVGALARAAGEMDEDDDDNDLDD